MGLIGSGGGLTSVCVVSSEKVKVRPGRVWSKGTILTYLRVTWEDHPCLLPGGLHTVTRFQGEQLGKGEKSKSAGEKLDRRQPQPGDQVNASSEYACWECVPLMWWEWHLTSVVFCSKPTTPV